MSARRVQLAIATQASLLGACSVLYDPSQFRGVDAARAPDAFVENDARADLDAALDAPALDDATLDAFAEIDAFTPFDAPVVPVDAFAPDAGRDAIGPDAWATCPIPTSMTFATCGDTGGLYYCPADDAGGDLAMISEATADVAVPATGHRLTLLGNAIAAWGGMGLNDFELVRELDRVAVVTSRGASLTRHRYDVSDTGLTDLDVDTYLGPPGTVDAIGDIAVSPGVLDGVAVMARDPISGWAAFSCPRFDAGCNTTTGVLMAQPATGTPFLAYAGTTLVAQVATMPAGDTWLVQRLDPAPLSSDTFMGPAPERLRSVEADLVLPDGAAPAMQMAYEPDSTVRALSIGQDEPRLAPSGATSHVLARVREGGGGLTVSILGVDCSGAACMCGPGCARSGADEAFVPLGVGNLVDWTFHVVDDDLRVAAFLVGDSGGTNVVVAWWRAGSPLVTVEPLVIASGRNVVPPGLGQSLRSVVRYQSGGSIDRLEILVAADVLLGTTEIVFLSGLRLEGCGS